MGSLAIPLPDPNDPNLPGAPPARPAPPDPMQDPAFRAFLVKQTQDQAALRAAQAQAAATRDSAGMRIGNGLLAFGGAPELIAQRYEQAGQPVKDVLARQEAERAGTKGAQEQTALAGSMFSNRQAVEGATPGSDISKAHAMLALHQGLIKPEDVPSFTATMDNTLHAGGTIQAARERAAAEIAIQRRHLAHADAQLAEETRHHKVEESFMGQKDLPATEQTELESKLDAVRALDDLKAQKGKSGLVDKLQSKLGLGGDYDQTQSAVAAEVAKADAKGRANPTGAIREKGLLPGPFQNDTGIDQKRKQLIGEARQHLNLLANGRVRPAQIAEYQKQIDALDAGSAGGSSAGAGFAGYRYSKDRKLRFPADASGKRLGPNEPVP